MSARWSPNGQYRSPTAQSHPRIELCVLPEKTGIAQRLQLQRGRSSSNVQIEGLLPQVLVEAFVQEHPDCVEERMQRWDVLKFVIHGKPVERGGRPTTTR